jgi:hypothetical protein
MRLYIYKKHTHTHTHTFISFVDCWCILNGLAAAKGSIWCWCWRCEKEEEEEGLGRAPLSSKEEGVPPSSVLLLSGRLDNELGRLIE